MIGSDRHPAGQRTQAVQTDRTVADTYSFMIVSSRFNKTLASATHDAHST